MLAFAVPSSHSGAVPYSWSRFDQIPPCFGQRTRISGGHDDTCRANNQGTIPDVGHYAWRSARHCFTNGDGKGFTAGCTSGELHPGKEAEPVMAPPQNIT